MVNSHLLYRLSYRGVRGRKRTSPPSCAMAAGEVNLRANPFPRPLPSDARVRRLRLGSREARLFWLRPRGYLPVCSHLAISAASLSLIVAAMGAISEERAPLRSPLLKALICATM